MTQPYSKIRVSNLEITFWKREIQRDNQTITLIQPSITRSWLDRNGKWENRSVNIGTMSQLYELLATAGEVRAIHQRFRAEQASQRAESGTPYQPEQAGAVQEPNEPGSKTEDQSMLFKK